MDFDISAFIPSEMRNQIVRELVDEDGIRPLARKVNVDPKTIYKYKEGSSRPRDETMAKILTIAKKDYPNLFDRQLEMLSTSFSAALGSLKRTKMTPSAAKSPETVDLKSTKVEGLPSEEKVFSLSRICNIINVSDPFERAKVGKILDAFQKLPKLSVNGIVKQSGVSKKAVKKYLELLLEEGFLDESSGKYNLVQVTRLEN